MHCFKIGARVLYGVGDSRYPKVDKFRCEVAIMVKSIPTDSVLRRHYEAVHGKKYANKEQSKNRGGFLSWLKRKFFG